MFSDALWLETKRSQVEILKFDDSALADEVICPHRNNKNFGNLLKILENRVAKTSLLNGLRNSIHDYWYSLTKTRYRRMTMERKKPRPVELVYGE